MTRFHEEVLGGVVLKHWDPDSDQCASFELGPFDVLLTVVVKKHVITEQLGQSVLLIGK